LGYLGHGKALTFLRETDTDGTTVTETLYYEHNGAQKSCAFVRPASVLTYEEPERVLRALLAQGKEPSGTITFDAEGNSWAT